MQSKKWLSFLLALLVSVALWVYVVTYENQEQSATINNIPIVFVGEDVLRDDYDLLIDKSSLEAGVSLTFYGKLSDIKKLQSAKSEISVQLDVSALIRSAREYSLKYDITDVTLPAAVSGSDLSLTEQDPREIKINVTNLLKKSIEVRVAKDIKLLEGYMMDDLIQEYDQIIIEGPESLVQQVDYALVTLSRENVDETVTSTLGYRLMSLDGEVLDTELITSDIQQIQVTIPVFMYKDVSLIVETIPGGGVSDSDVSIDISPKRIRLSGEKDVLDAIDHIKLSNIDLSGMESNEKILERDFATPDGCINLSGINTAEVTVKIHNKSIKSVRVPKDDFVFINVPDGLVAEATTAMLNVTVRANSVDIDQIQTETLRVVADLSGITVQEGVFTVQVPITIYIDGFEGTAGTIGEYRVFVELSPMEPTDDEEQKQ